MAGCVWVSGQTAASSSQSVARTESCQHRLWRTSQRGLNILSQDADSQIPATRLLRRVPHPRSRLECTVMCLAFGFDSSLYPGSVPVGVEVHGWQHGRVLGFNGLRIHRELEGLKWSFLKKNKKTKTYAVWLTKSGRKENYPSVEAQLPEKLVYQGHFECPAKVTKGVSTVQSSHLTGIPSLTCLCWTSWGVMFVVPQDINIRFQNQVPAKVYAFS